MSTELVVEKKGGQGQQFGDTTLTKVFVGGLAWETQKEAMRSHFEQFGEILEAVIISDKVTGRSKGYGFVTFKDPEAAKKACEDATPVINGRRANCNLASLGARRSRAPTPQPDVGVEGPTNNNTSNNTGTRTLATAPTGGAVQWYYPTGAAAAPFHHHQAVPFHAYGYSPAYYTDPTYNPKLGYGGSYVTGQYPQFYHAQGMMSPSTVLPVYPYFHFHQSQTMGLPAQLFPQNTATAAVAPAANMPGYISKPPPLASNTGMTVQQKVSVREA
ncbi:probable RNA-binding protein ARP1 isoform X1 [Nymphaea colorata]|nr:probable RNA-binding protein ARP1 isoform X1 [Nymphaea colorata]